LLLLLENKASHPNLKNTFKMLTEKIIY